MDKFSIYEFLSFVLPGAVLVYIFQQTMSWDFMQITTTSDAEDGIVFFSLSLLVGLLLHRLSFFCIQKEYRWYNWVLYRPIENYTKNGNINKAFSEIVKITGEKSIDDCFDEAYWYLEAEDKIGSAKMFQSMYFYMRNMVMAYFVAIPFLLLFYFLGDEKQKIIVFLISGLLISLVIIFFLADFYRMKMTERLLCNYEQLLKNKKN